MCFSHEQPYSPGQIHCLHDSMVSVSECRLGEAAEEGELELGSKLLGNAPLTTRERIRRDRELHRLGLNLVERIPKDVLIDLVQVCKSCSSSLCESVSIDCFASDSLHVCLVCLQCI